ncbi:hypothetical protein [Enterobacter bugandensis]|uniref:hypothetical protein n=1 Tax=Enterobacter bugandensis TaxID=881260 RepID=UPI002072EB1A|nr:hypothetical protein [Enterobacter bugandensis]
MSTLTKEWLLKTIAELEEEHDATPGAVNEDAANALAAMKLALASLEAEAVGEVVLGEFDDCGCHPDARVACIAADGQADWENFKDGTRLYTAPPAPVSVPAAMEMDDDFDSAFEHGKAVGWNACRAAMLQGADGNSPVIQDGWVMLPAEPTQAMMNAWLSEVANWRGHAAGYRAMIAAAPQQEVESQIRKGKTVAREEWELGARLTKHRFKP